MCNKVKYSSIIHRGVLFEHQKSKSSSKTRSGFVVHQGEGEDLGPPCLYTKLLGSWTERSEFQGSPVREDPERMHPG